MTNGQMSRNRNIALYGHLRAVFGGLAQPGRVEKRVVSTQERVSLVEYFDKSGRVVRTYEDCLGVIGIVRN